VSDLWRLAATVVGIASVPVAAAENSGTAIRPFKVKVPEADLAELRRRIVATNWPEPEPVAGVLRTLLTS
jgi:hypothetical protein